ncbi:MAG: phosphate ABC transporter permease subunit PstC [Rhizomicrobium sp.]
MADLPLTAQYADSARAKALRRLSRSDVRFRLLTRGAAGFVVVLFAGIMVALVSGALPAFRAFGWGFFTSAAWNPVTEKFGALAPVYGTVVTSVLAMLLAVPLGIGIAIFLTEICPRALKRPIGIAIELLAGIPSIIYGVWGLFVFAPFFQQNIQPGLIDFFANIPVLQDLFAGPPYGIGIFTASLILSIMILPFIAAVSRDVFQTVPIMQKEAAYGIGCTTWEVMWRIVLPFSRSGVVGGGMLALGRALGETMAVTFVIGNAHYVHASLFSVATTISATIANEFTEALGPLYVSSLFAIGLILFGITFVVLALAQFMLYSLERRAGGSTA